MQKTSMWNTPCHLWLGSQDITVAESHHHSSCWPLMVSGLPAGITSLPVLTLQEGTTPSPASIWLLLFLLGFACTEQELPQTSLLLISYCTFQVGSWWFSANLPRLQKAAWGRSSAAFRQKVQPFSWSAWHRLTGKPSTVSMQPPSTHQAPFSNIYIAWKGKLSV